MKIWCVSWDFFFMQFYVCLVWETRVGESEPKKKRAQTDASQMTCEPTEKVPRVKGPRVKGPRGKGSWRPTYLNQHIWTNISEPTYCMSKKGTCYYDIFSIQKVPTHGATSWGLCEAIRHQKREWTKTRSEDKSELKKKRGEPDASQMTCEPTCEPKGQRV